VNAISAKKVKQAQNKCYDGKAIFKLKLPRYYVLFTKTISVTFYEQFALNLAAKFVNYITNFRHLLCLKKDTQNGYSLSNNLCFDDKIRFYLKQSI
jgi:hypothetical protein